MRPEDLQVEIRPRSAGQTVSLAARMLQHHPGPLLGAWASCCVPPLLLTLALLFWLELDPWWVWTVMLLTMPLFTLPMYSGVGLLVFSQKVKVWTMVRTALLRFVPFTLLFVAVRVLSVLGLLALVIPGFYLWRTSWFLASIVLLERSPLGVSLRRSRRFAAGFHSHVLGHAANTGAVLAYFSLAGAALFRFVVEFLLGPTIATVGALAEHDLYYHLAGLVGFCLATPFAVLVWFFVYLDVRTRKEGWDLEISFRARAQQMERSRA